MLDEHCPEHQLSQAMENFRAEIRRSEAQALSEDSSEKVRDLRSSQETGNQKARVPS